ncbi:hypothetical protein [Marimonas arenosa]|uniref:Uncharacterized protein n=1 Tax=Marimonas arenosa TaxID=1795305 RepID=A0AAE3WB44_9RHOB|nr:hypothetical protein [Marimonas arenosa]MDQ2089439.1 hypothetical protein [Marimonas arenosa]
MRLILAITTAVALSTTAHAFTAINGLTVNPVPGGFEVVASGGDGPRQIWCAAGQYARAQGPGARPRIYILEPYGPSRTRPGWKGVSFTTTPAPDLVNGPRLGDDGNYSVRLRTRGFNLTTGHAESFCADVWDLITEHRLLR